MTTPTATPTLLRLVDENLSRAPEYAGGLSNHLPMALHALADLGAGDATLERFAAGYVRRKRLAGAGAMQSAPPLRLGDFAAFAAWQSHFAARIADVGSAAAVAEALPDLWPGVAAAAFHGPIRVAHAWQIGHDWELAAALAYWAARWQAVDVRIEPEPSLDLDLDAWLAAAEAAATSFHCERHLISQCMDDASRTPAFLRFAPHLRPTDDALPRFARWAAGLYAQTGNFTVLHLVTGARAVLTLSAVAAPPPQVWHALAAAIVGSGIGEREPFPRITCSWNEVVEEALRSEDDHVIKLVHACAQLSGRRSDDKFLAAAQCAVR